MAFEKFKRLMNLPNNTKAGLIQDDEVLMYANKAAFPTTGKDGKVYIDLALLKAWIWKTNAYVAVRTTADSIVDPPVYADNAAAVTGGLAIGKLYRTGDTLKVVHA